MDIVTCTLLVAVVSALVIYLWTSRPDPRLPPCPTRPLPIVGHLLTLNKDPRPQFRKWREQCGDMFSLYMGNSLIVVLCGYDLMKETLLKRPDEFADRPAGVFFDEATGIPNKGVMMSSGPVWKEQRGIAMSILRSLGMGRNVLAEYILKEIKCYLELLEKFKGDSHELKLNTTMSAANVLCSIIIGERFDYEDATFQDLMAKATYISEDLQTSNILTFLPWLRYLPGDLLRAKKTKACSQHIIQTFIKKFIHQGSRDRVDENTDNFIAAYLSEMRKKKKSDEPTSMDEEQLARIMMDLMTAGTETLSSSLLWTVLYAINYPEVQKKLHEEIKQVIGTERPPTMEDKVNLTFVNAFIMEVQRIACVAAVSFFHTCPAEVKLRGYTIPKGTNFIPLLDSISYDKKIWGDDPYTLRPQRFIDENGKLKNIEEYIPFGLGRRVCMGEAIAKMELFLYTTSMFQKFEFQALNPACPPPIVSVVGLDVYPAPFKLRVIKRSTEA